jgi:hypothetical protein
MRIAANPAAKAVSDCLREQGPLFYLLSTLPIPHPNNSILHSIGPHTEINKAAYAITESHRLRPRSADSEETAEFLPRPKAGAATSSVS